MNERAGVAEGKHPPHQGGNGGSTPPARYPSRLTVLSLGAGVQSTTILLMAERGLLPPLDHAVFADTQWEKPGTYRLLEWLEAHCRIPIHRVTVGSLPGTVLRSQTEGGSGRFASMPLYIRRKSGKKGLLRRQCTSEYKIRPVLTYIRRSILGLRKGQWFPKTVYLEKWLGISSDESHRARITSRVEWEHLAYPLLNLPRDFLPRPMSRRGCELWLKANYPDLEVEQSSCVGCPFHANREWRHLKEKYPDLWEEAVEFDRGIRNLRGMDSKAYLHPSLQPLDEVDLGEDTEGGWGNECSGICHV